MYFFRFSQMRAAAREDVSPFKHKKMKRNRKIRVLLTLYIRKTAAYTETIPEWVRVRQTENGGITMTENKTLCIACKYKFHDRDLQPCADCLRSTQLAQQGIDRYQRAAQPQQYRDNPHGAYESQEGGGHDGQ